MGISAQDKAVLRELARQTAEIAGKPFMEERRGEWRLHNRLRPGRPRILVFPEGAWRELLPPGSERCEGSEACAIESQLRMRIYGHEHFDDDTVVERDYLVHKSIQSTGWGIDAKWVHSESETGARGFDPVITGPSDLKKLRLPQISCDEEASRRNFEMVSDAIGDILDVRLVGVKHISFHLMSLYTSWRGLEQVMMDMYEEPEMLRDAMAFLEEGHRGIVRQYQQLGLLELNNDNSYHSSGGVGHTDELPRLDFVPGQVRPCDLWCSAEAQEMAQVSPEMHEEFILSYERRLLSEFGLNGYGCCEDVTHKLDQILQIPRLRRLSISPWANVGVCAERLKGDLIFSWKPHPAHLVGEFHPGRIKSYIRGVIDVCTSHGCVLEMILKDTHTCEGHPERFDIWTRLAREAIAESQSK